MKFKFLSIVMAVAVAFAFSSCKNETSASGSGSGSASGNEDKNNTEKVEKTNDANEVAEEANEVMAPTGDIEKDAKVILDKLTSVKTAEEAKDLLDLSSKFDSYYEAKGEEAFQKWSETGQKAISSDPKLQEAVKNLQKLAAEAE